MLNCNVFLINFLAMQNKLQELTDKLYNEGLAKGKQEADNLLAQARSQAGDIVAAAKAEAEKIVSDARREAEDLKGRVAGDVKMASSQTLAALRQQIEQMIETKVVGDKVDEALSDKQFMGKLLQTVVGAFSAGSAGAGLDVILPAEMKASAEGFLADNIGKELAKGLDLSFTDAIKGGFRIAPKGKGYFIDFSDESFKALLGEYLRPATNKILFG